MEESQANFLESRVQPTPRNAPARGKGSGPAKARSEAHAPGPWRLSPSSVGASVAHWATLSGPALGSSPRTARWRSTAATFRESLGPAARSAGPPRAAGTTLSRHQGALLVAVRDPRHSLPISERGQRVRAATFPTRVAVPEEGAGASRSAEERRGKVLVFSEKHPVFQASGHLISHSFYV